MKKKRFLRILSCCLCAVVIAPLIVYVGAYLCVRATHARKSQVILPAGPGESPPIVTRFNDKDSSHFYFRHMLALDKAVTGRNWEMESWAWGHR